MPHAPVLAAWDQEAGGWAEAGAPLCVARRTGVPLKGRSELGELCGQGAEHRIAGIDLCGAHFYILERWRFADSRAEEIRRESAELREAMRVIEEDRAEYGRTLADAEAHWERLAAADSVVYYLRRVSDGMVKIGTSANFRGRLHTHSYQHGALQVLLICAGRRPEEHATHLKFRAYQIGRTEWFRPVRPIFEHILKMRSEERWARIQPSDALPIEEIKRLAREAPRKMDLQWDDDGVLVWPPQAAQRPASRALAAS